MSFFSYEKFESLLSNFSFVILFFSMLAYWIETSGTLVLISERKNVSIPLIQGTENIPAEASESSLFDSQTKVFTFGSDQKVPLLRGQKKFKFGKICMALGNLSLFFLLSLRWLESGHFPLSNLYESLMFLSWALTLFHLFLEQTNENQLFWLGAITSPIALFTNAFANFSLPAEMQHSSALVPALQSNWLMMHVTVMILSYAALIFGSLLSIGFLILSFGISSEAYEHALKTEIRGISPMKFQWAQNLDNLSYRMLGIGFPLLTIGILSGAVWANEAWGSYWSWDPKETWALLTWLVFAIYLHSRITKKWQGKKPAMIASFGFFVVWICYLGVNLLGEGLHSYGWLKL